MTKPIAFPRSKPPTRPRQAPFAIGERIKHLQVVSVLSQEWHSFSNWRFEVRPDCCGRPYVVSYDWLRSLETGCVTNRSLMCDHCMKVGQRHGGPIWVLRHRTPKPAVPDAEAAVEGSTTPHRMSPAGAWSPPSMLARDVWGHPCLG